MAADAITLADIRSADWSLALGAIGEVVQGIADVEQCLGIIVTTPRGSDPLRPTFGADIWRYIDFPISLALPAIVSELTSAITIWEPRVNLVSVTAQPCQRCDGAIGRASRRHTQLAAQAGRRRGAGADHDRDNPGSDGLAGPRRPR